MELELEGNAHLSAVPPGPLLFKRPGRRIEEKRGHVSDKQVEERPGEEKSGLPTALIDPPPRGQKKGEKQRGETEIRSPKREGAKNENH